MARILVAEDEPTFRELLGDILEGAGHHVVAVADGESALAALQRGGFDLLLTDQRMPRLSGLALLHRLRAVAPTLPTVVLTAHGTIPEAVEAVRLGAADYLTKPLPSPRALLAVVDRVLGPGAAEEPVVTVEPRVERLLELIDRVARRDVAVLITGESGTGKELVARRLHRASPRAARQFVAVNCAAFPDSLAESELFGHERGAFTGAERQRSGRFEEASGGTLFLDEVGELSPQLQAKLLRVLEERLVRRLGGSADLPVDLRLVTATNRDVEAEVERGGFRRDLYFRLAVVRVDLPPLRERVADIPVLARHLLRTLSARHGGRELEIAPDAIAALSRYTWPGNVRELRNVIERAVVVRGSGRIVPEDLALPSGAPRADALSLDRQAREREAVLEALRRTGGNREEAARVLGVSVRTLYYRLHNLGIT